MASREKITNSLVEAIRIKGVADAFEKLMYMVASVLGVAFFFFIINLMGVKNFIILMVAFAGLAVVKGLFVLMIK
ncbi:MAG: hypothetical protein QGI49_11890 [SAR202 cluster bacterium]|jgi:hypothetical protein|nr:hypothetical protein [SAR202 cluster bacterium]